MNETEFVVYCEMLEAKEREQRRLARRARNFARLLKRRRHNAVLNGIVGVAAPAVYAQPKYR